MEKVRPGGNFGDCANPEFLLEGAGMGEGR